MICPSCNKFAAFDTGNDPEVEIDIDQFEYAERDPVESDADDADLTDKSHGTAMITGTVRILLTSECCSEEMKESTFDVDEQIEVERADGCECDFTEDLSLTTGEETTDRMETESVTIAKRGPNKGKEVRKPIPARYAKRFYGAEVTIEVSCACGKTTVETQWKEEVPASGMDGLV